MLTIISAPYIDNNNNKKENNSSNSECRYLQALCSETLNIESHLIFTTALQGR